MTASTCGSQKELLRLMRGGGMERGRNQKNRCISNSRKKRASDGNIKITSNVYVKIHNIGQNVTAMQYNKCHVYKC